MIDPKTGKEFVAGMLLYDVPTKKTHLYGRIRNAIEGFCLMQTWSCYMFNWAFKDHLLQELEKMNEGVAKGNRVEYRLLLLDQGQHEEHEQMVLEALHRLLQNTNKLLADRLKKAQAEIALAEKEQREPKETMGKARKYAVGKARKTILKAVKLAAMFHADQEVGTAVEALKAVVTAEAELEESIDLSPLTGVPVSFASYAGRVVD